MAKSAGGAVLAHLEARGSSAPLYLEIYRSIRSAILRGDLAPGARLPSTRTLASDLGLSRSTAEEAFGQLLAEGFVERRVGDGTYVAEIVTPAAPLGVRSRGPLGFGGAPVAARVPGRRGEAGSGAPVETPARRLSARARSLLAVDTLPDPVVPVPFSGGSIEIETFPLETWRGLLSRSLRRAGSAALRSGDPAGYRPLREAIASYAATARGVIGTPEQVIVLTSSQQALDLAARLLIDPGETAWVEDPGYPGARAALLGAGARVVPVPVDAEGLRVEAGEALAGDARLAYVTPSHQYPLGVTMSLSRRLALLDWARRSGGWIVEDDYDSEFCYEGRPLAAIQGIDGDGRVLYVGTFTKVLFPSIRLAYAIVPPDLVAPFVRARVLMDSHTATLPQMALAELFREGHFGVHIRRVRELYRERRDALVQAVRRWLPESVRCGAAHSGLHLVLQLPEGSDDLAAARRAEREGIVVVPLSRHFHGPDPRPGLFLGFGALRPEEIEGGIRRLASVL